MDIVLQGVKMTIKKNTYLDSEQFKATILRLLEDDMLTYSDHAIDRMNERDISQVDIKNLFLSPYEFVGMQSEHGMVYIARNKRNRHQLPKVIFGINKNEDTNNLWINVITTYFDLNHLENEEDDMMAQNLEHQLDLEAQRGNVDLEPRILLSHEQYNQLYLIVMNEVYIPHMRIYGYGALTTINTYKKRLEWVIRTAEDDLTYSIEGASYQELLNRIHYGDFKTEEPTKNEKDTKETIASIIKEEMPYEALPCYDGEVFDAHAHKINQKDVSKTYTPIKELTSSYRFGHLVNITLRSATRIEQAILAFEHELIGTFEYLKSPIMTAVVYERATVYTITTAEIRSECYIVTGKSHEYLMSLCEDYYEAYGEKISCPLQVFDSLSEDIDAYLADEIDFQHIVNFALNTKEADMLVKMPNAFVKHVQLPHNVYHYLLRKYGLEEEVVAEEQKEPKISEEELAKQEEAKRLHEEEAKKEEEARVAKQEAKRLARAEKKRQEAEMHRLENKKRREEREKKALEKKAALEAKRESVEEPVQEEEETIIRINPRFKIEEGIRIEDRVQSLLLLNNPLQIPMHVEWDEVHDVISYEQINNDATSNLYKTSKMACIKDASKEIEKIEKRLDITLDEITDNHVLVYDYMKIEGKKLESTHDDYKRKWKQQMYTAHLTQASLNFLYQWLLSMLAMDDSILNKHLSDMKKEEYLMRIGYVTSSEIVLVFEARDTKKDATHYQLTLDISDNRLNFLRKHMSAQQLHGEWGGGKWINTIKNESYDSIAVSHYCLENKLHLVYAATTKQGVMLLHDNIAKSGMYETTFISKDTLESIKDEMGLDRLFENPTIYVECNDREVSESKKKKKDLFPSDIFNSLVKNQKKQELIQRYRNKK